MIFMDLMMEHGTKELQCNNFKLFVDTTGVVEENLTLPSFTQMLSKSFK